MHKHHLHFIEWVSVYVTAKKSVSNMPLGSNHVSCTSCSLADLCLPTGLDQEQMAELDRIIQKRKKVSRGQYLYRSGDEAENLYSIRSGSIKLVVGDPAGAEQVTGFYLPGELVGLDALASGEHGCSAQALELTTVCALPLKEFDALCTQIPDLRRHTMRAMGRELNQDHRLMLSLGKLDAEERLAAFLLNISNRLAQRGFSAKEFNMSMPRHDLANYLGVAVETLSRLFSRLQDDGVLAIDKLNRRHVTLIDMDRLRALAHEACMGSTSCDKNASGAA